MCRIALLYLLFSQSIHPCPPALSRRIARLSDARGANFTSIPLIEDKSARGGVRAEREGWGVEVDKLKRQKRGPKPKLVGFVGTLASVSHWLVAFCHWERPFKAATRCGSAQIALCSSAWCQYYLLPSRHMQLHLANLKLPPACI